MRRDKLPCRDRNTCSGPPPPQDKFAPCGHDQARLSFASPIRAQGILPSRNDPGPVCGRSGPKNACSGQARGPSGWNPRRACAFKGKAGSIRPLRDRKFRSIIEAALRGPRTPMPDHHVLWAAGFGKARARSRARSQSLSLTASNAVVSVGALWTWRLRPAATGNREDAKDQRGGRAFKWGNHWGFRRFCSSSASILEANALRTNQTFCDRPCAAGGKAGSRHLQSHMTKGG